MSEKLKKVAVLLILSGVGLAGGAASAAIFQAQDKMSALGTAGAVPAPDFAIKGFSVFGSTNVLTYISTAPGNTVFNGAVQVSSDIYVLGASTFSSAAFFGSTITANWTTGLRVPLLGAEAATKYYVDASLDLCALGSAATTDIMAGKTADINCDNLAETGTMPVQTFNPANDTVNAGYYAATTLSAADTDLAAGNIALGVDIFGKTGTYAGAYALPDAGQTGSYTATFGEDHDYAPAAAQPNYTDNGNGTTTDNRTGLMWANNGTSPGCANGTYITWEAALVYCEGLTYAGFSDWRLPNNRELLSIINFQNNNPAIDTTYFINTMSYFYWSSTSNSSNAMEVLFTDGTSQAMGKANTLSVRCVRAGP